MTCPIRHRCTLFDHVYAGPNAILERGARASTRRTWTAFEEAAR